MKSHHTLRYKVFSTVIGSDDFKKENRYFQLFMTILIILSIISIVLATVPEIRESYYSLIHGFELFTVICFSIEYICAVWSCVELPKYSRPVKGRLHYIATPLAIVDLISILPLFLRTFTTMDLRFVRAIRLFRLLRLLKLEGHAKSLRMIVRVLKSKRQDFAVAFLIIFLLLVISSSLMYYVEYDSQPKAFASIPDALWWGVMTLTTIGYGDIIPTTGLGKILTSFISILGVGVFTLPSAIFTAGLFEEFQNMKKKTLHCPHCGEKISG